LVPSYRYFYTDLNIAFFGMFEPPFTCQQEKYGNHTSLIGTSHYGQRSRGCGILPIKFQETKSSASKPVALWPSPSNYLYDNKLPTWRQTLIGSLGWLEIEI